MTNHSRASAALQAATEANAVLIEIESTVRSLATEIEFDPAPSEQRMVRWLEKCSRLPGRAPLAVGVHLLRQAIKYGRIWHLPAGTADVAYIKMSRTSVHSALVSLEGAGLITTLRRTGQSPLATVIGIGTDDR